MEPVEAAGVLACGMGGSAIGGDLAAAALGDRLTRPMHTVRGYGLPSWATPEWTVLAISCKTRVERLLWATMLGDLVSVELADAR